MSRMEDLSAQHLARVEDHLAIQAGHSGRLPVFLEGLVVSPVVIRSVLFPAAVFMEAELALAGGSTVAVAAADN